MIAGNILLGIVFSYLLVLLRRWELDLRSDAPGTSNVRRYAQYFYLRDMVLFGFQLPRLP